MRSRHICVTVDLDRIRASAECIRRKTGVLLIAVIKADAYGCGAVRVADALASVVDDFAYFSLPEAREVGQPGVVLGPPEEEPAHYKELNLRPTVATQQDVDRFTGCRLVLNVDTGMQRFGCSPEEANDLLKRNRIAEACTHTADLRGVEALRSVCDGRVQRLHAAATALLDHPQAWLDGVRPGLALYRGALRVAARLVLVRETRGRVGYSGFECSRVGVILGGYSNFLRPGPVLVNGRRQQLIEAGMNTSYVSVDPSDRAGDEVVLLGDGLTEDQLAAHFHCRPHEILCRYGSMGVREYRSDNSRANVVNAGGATASV